VQRTIGLLRRTAWHTAADVTWQHVRVTSSPRAPGRIITAARTFGAKSRNYAYRNSQLVLLPPPRRLCFAGFCLFVCLSGCLSVSKITQKVMDGSFRNFEGMSGMAQTTSDSILGVIRQESWIRDYFESFVSMALKGA